MSHPDSTDDAGRSEQADRVEHLVLTTVVKSDAWRSDSAAVLATAQATLAQRAQQRGLLLQGEPQQQVEVLTDFQRVRITMTADAVPPPEHPPLS